MDRTRDVAELEARREELRRRLFEAGDLRPGSLVEVYRKCGKPNCWCAKPGVRGHGPTLILTHQEEGRTVTRSIPKEDADRTREQVAEYRRFRETVREFVAVNEALCDARLREAVTERGEASKKTPPGADRGRGRPGGGDADGLRPGGRPGLRGGGDRGATGCHEDNRALDRTEVQRRQR